MVKVDAQRRNGSLVARVQSPTIETENVAAFRAAVAPVLEQSDQVVLDLSEVTFMDSTGLGALLSCLRLMKAKNASLRIAGLTPDVRRLFDIVMMDRVFEVFPSVDEAMAKAGA